MRPGHEVVRFKRNHFSARLPVRFLYSPTHFWLFESEPGSWQVGMTTFATRMLGEIVELDFEVEEGREVNFGEVIGWIEGFKAVSDIYCIAAGRFGGANPKVMENTEIICSDPYGDGWIYRVEGSPDAQATDVAGYVAHLNRTIDKMLEKPWRPAEREP
jgi:glycine cleavage system H protein